MNKDKIKNILTQRTKAELTVIARSLNIPSYSKKRKIELVECILEDCALKDVKKVLNIGIWNQHKWWVIGTVLIQLIIGGIYHIRL